MLAPDKIMSSIDSRSVPAHSRAGGDNESLTGPDRNIANIRRQGSLRRSLRSSRCQSVVITEKERTLLIKQDKKMAGPDGKVASKGFVRSMCKLYEPRVAAAAINRRNSFNASL